MKKSRVNLWLINVQFRSIFREKLKAKICGY